MYRSIVSRPARFVVVASRSLADASAAAPAGSNLLINFNTPHAPIMPNKQVKHVILPGDHGEYGVTAGHAPLIAQLKPGIVAVTHTGVSP
jgi:hypothetical protein